MDCEEALYGGAAGGGKTDALLMGALQWVDWPDYNAIIFRKTLQDHKKPDGLIARTHEWLEGKPAVWNGQDYKWTFPSGATLTLGYMDIDADVYHHQGAAYNYIGWDELTQFQKWQYDYLISRNRRLKDCYIPLRIRAATNPGGRGHAWVKQYFIVEGAKCDRAFIPAKLDDNPFLDRENYIKALNKLDPTLRKQLREGSWEAHIGTMFHRDWFKIIEPSQVPENIYRVRYWDMASTEAEKGKDPDWTSGALMGFYKGQYFIFDIEHFQKTPKGTADKVRAVAEVDSTRLPPVQIWMEEEGGSSGKIASDYYAREILPGFPFHCEHPTGSKEVRAGPFSTAAENRNVFLVRGDWINAFLDEAEVFPEGEHDDQIDACSGALNVLTLAAKASSGSGIMFPKSRS